MSSCSNCPDFEISKGNYKFDMFFSCFLKDLKRIESHYDSLSEYQKERLKVIGAVVKLKGRNSTLAKLVFLHAAVWIANCHDINDLIAKRGKKTDPYGLPIKLIMRLLKCSRRTATDYQIALVAIYKSSRLIDLIGRDS